MNETEVAVKLAEHEEKIKVANNRIADLENKTNTIEKLALSVQKIAIATETLTKNQIEYQQKQEQIAKKLVDIEGMPLRSKAEKHDFYVDTVLKLVIGAIVGFLLKSLLGL